MEEIKYGIVSIDEYDYSFNYDANLENMDISAVRYRLSHQLRPNKEKNQIEVRIKVSVYSPDATVLLAEDAVRVVYLVEPFDSFVVNTTEDGFNVTQPVLMDTLFGVAIGALRGLLSKSLKGTPLSGCVLPLIPMKDIRKNTQK